MEKLSGFPTRHDKGQDNEAGTWRKSMAGLNLLEISRFAGLCLLQNQAIMTIKEAQEQADNWIKTYGVRYFSELTNTAILMEEVGELARIMARRYGEQSEKESDKNADLGDEMADVLWVLICLANQTGIDLTEAWQRNMDKKTSRDHSRHLNNPKLQNPE